MSKNKKDYYDVVVFLSKEKEDKVDNILKDLRKKYEEVEFAKVVFDFGRIGIKVSGYLTKREVNNIFDFVK